MKRAILCFQGYRQSESDRSGMEDMFERDIRPLASRELTTYHPRTWTTNVDHLVDQLSRQHYRRVAIISYSHGQAAATAFARKAYAAGIDVDLWLACDPVYRPTWLPRKNWLQWLAFRALLKKGRIKVPVGISRVAYVRQEENLPCGHELVLTTPSQRTIIAQPLVLNYEHAEMDEAPEWIGLVRQELAAWIRHTDQKGACHE